MHSENLELAAAVVVGLVVGVSLARLKALLYRRMLRRKLVSLLPQSGSRLNSSSSLSRTLGSWPPRPQTGSAKSSPSKTSGSDSTTSAARSRKVRGRPGSLSWSKRNRRRS